MADDYSQSRNDNEADFAKMALSKGWQITKRGWPDFLCSLPDGTTCAVEVKPRLRTDKSKMKILKRQQAKTMALLVKSGIPCYVSDGEILEPFNPKIHADGSRRYKK